MQPLPAILAGLITTALLDTGMIMVHGCVAGHNTRDYRRLSRRRHSAAGVRLARP